MWRQCSCAFAVLLTRRAPHTLQKGLPERASLASQTGCVRTENAGTPQNNNVTSNIPSESTLNRLAISSVTCPGSHSAHDKAACFKQAHTQSPAPNEKSQNVYGNVCKARMSGPCPAGQTSQRQVQRRPLQRQALGATPLTASCRVAQRSMSSTTCSTSYTGKVHTIPKQLWGRGLVVPPRTAKHTTSCRGCIACQRCHGQQPAGNYCQGAQGCACTDPWVACYLSAWPYVPYE